MHGPHALCLKPTRTSPLKCIAQVLKLAGGNPSLKFTVRGRLLESRIPPSTLIRVPMALNAAHACVRHARPHCLPSAGFVSEY